MPVLCLNRQESWDASILVPEVRLKQTIRMEDPAGQATPAPRHSLVERDLMASVLSSAVVPAEVERLEMVADVGSCLPTTQLRELPAAQLP